MIVTTSFVIAAGLMLAAPSPAASPCPTTLTLWEASEEVVPGRAWTFRYLDIDDDLARFRELEVWFELPKVSSDEARWFVPESARTHPWPSLLSVSSRSYPVEELHALCEELEPAGLEQIRDAASEMCGPGMAVGEGNLAAASVTAVLRTSARRDGMRYGVVARPEPDDERCRSAGPDSDQAGSVERSIRVETRVTREVGQPGGESDEVLSGAVHGVIDVWGRFLSESHREESGPQGLAAMPGARRMLALLSGLDAAGAPEALRSELSLAVGAAAPRDYVVALALEVLEMAEAREQLGPALQLLGDRASPAARDDLVARLREPREDDEVVALALRALLKIDPDAARLEALGRLRDGSPAAVGALGVFAMTEPLLADELEGLDLDDADAVSEAARRTVSHIASTAVDDDLRAGAVEILRDDPGSGSP